MTGGREVRSSQADLMDIVWRNLGGENSGSESTKSDPGSGIDYQINLHRNYKVDMAKKNKTRNCNPGIFLKWICW